MVPAYAVVNGPCDAEEASCDKALDDEEVDNHETLEAVFHSEVEVVDLVGVGHSDA